ncbi:tetratricopeptide repeat protein [Roseivivax isoporae]|uniref:Uncharacterized protein n=1 Tax=Roseivivax isoporae LMG 25204 TaxID=1449351 RepID=X7F817_9RHOB|nr:hypothetical protein [Roseivivax isoporae]ETX28878.1 hypothetical protein RISW2_03985 [Roseivivax isoporae LMG 25204]
MPQTRAAERRTSGAVDHRATTAYAALAANDLPRAVRLAHGLTQARPDRPDGWLVLGGAALARNEASAALRFFTEAARVAPGDALAHEGLAKAQLLSGDPVRSLAAAEEALTRGSSDVGLVRIYMELMMLFGWSGRMDEAAGVAIRRNRDIVLVRLLANALLGADRPAAAVEWLNLSWEIDPAAPESADMRLLALLLTHQFDAALAFHAECRDAGRASDFQVGCAMRALRETGRHGAALALFDEHPFEDLMAYKIAASVAANIHQDLGDAARAEAAYREAITLTTMPGPVPKAFGAFLFRQRRLAEGLPYYARRIPESGRRVIAEANAAPENLAARDRVFLFGEQGIGDQLALLTLLRDTPLDPARQELFLVTDERFAAVLEGSPLGLTVLPEARVTRMLGAIDGREIVYLGDLVRYLAPEARRPAPILRPDPGRVEGIRRRYLAEAPNGRIFGVAWSTGNPIGHLRNLPLERVLAPIPAGSLVVDLQYGDHAAEIAAARAARPDLAFVTDPEIDQMHDLAGFAAQIAALDTVVSIDNTTVHVCGALGHPDTHVLLPTGSECMWYWGAEGTRDPWYGALTLHRQPRFGDWDAALASVAAALAGTAA